MKDTYTQKARWLLGLILVVIFVLGLLNYQKQLQYSLQVANNESEKELSFISALVKERLQSHDYQLAKSFILEWGKSSSDIEEIILSTRNGFQIASYKTAHVHKPSNEYVDDIDISYSYDRQATISLHKSLDSVYDFHQDSLYEMFAGYILICILLYFLMRIIIQTHDQKINLAHENIRRKQVEEELRKHKNRLEDDIKLRTNELSKTIQKLKLHFQQTPLGVIEWDKDFKVVEWNQSAENIFGYTSKEALGKHATELILPSHYRTAVDEIWYALLENKGGERSTNKNITKEGRSITCEWYNTPLVNEEGSVIGVASLVQDITLRIEQEKELILAKESAENANKSKSEFLANMSHELRTPLHGILSFAMLGEERIENLSVEKLKKYFKNIHASSDRLLVLVNDLLELSKLESGKFKLEIGKINLHEVVDNCIAEQEANINESSLEVSCDFSENFPLVECDKNRIGQVIMNLLGNAIKFSPEGGHIQITVSTFSQQENDQDMDMYRFSFADQGKGVLDEEKESIFNKFIQSNQHEAGSGGTGLGLAITRELINEHQGSIRCEDAPGGGAIFIFELPVYLEDRLKGKESF